MADNLNEMIVSPSIMPCCVSWIAASASDSSALAASSRRLDATSRQSDNPRDGYPRPEIRSSRVRRKPDAIQRASAQALAAANTLRLPSVVLNKSAGSLSLSASPAPVHWCRCLPRSGAPWRGPWSC